MNGNYINSDSFAPIGEIFIKGCKVTLNFIPESNGNAIDTVKKILISSALEHRNISSETVKKTG